jgi:cysteine desulfurase / selenocysteine lyase
LYSHEMSLIRHLRDGLASLERVTLYCARSLEHHLPVLACNIEGVGPEQVSAILDGDFGIATRAGLQCAPLVHQSLGTSRMGAVRFSLGRFNTGFEIDRIVEAMGKICRLEAG